MYNAVLTSKSNFKTLRFDIKFCFFRQHNKTEYQLTTLLFSSEIVLTLCATNTINVTQSSEEEEEEEHKLYITNKTHCCF